MVSRAYANTKGARLDGVNLCDVCFDNPLGFLGPDASVEQTYLVRSCPPPKKSHFHGTRALSLDRVVANTNCSCIVSVHWGFRLRVSHV